MQEKNAKTCDKGSEDGWNSVRESKAKRNRQPRNFQSSSSDWGKVPLQIEYIPPDETTTRFVPYMLLLAGLPGSGKTTFARSLLESMPYKFARVNQDEMGSRKKCITNAKSAISKGLCIIVDRCNFDEDQRAVWYELAREHNYPVDSVVLAPPVSLCIKRCEERKNHETIAPDKASSVVRIVQRQWKSPTRREQQRSMRNFQEVCSTDEYNQALLFHVNQR